MNDQFAAAIRRFDEENSRDPNSENGQPRELLYAQRLAEWVRRLSPAASEPLRLASHCQHLCRWMIPRGKHVTVLEADEVKAGDPLCVLADYAVLYIQGKAFEQDAAALWKTVEDAIDECLARAGGRQVDAVGISNQRESVLVWERATGAPTSMYRSWMAHATSRSTHAISTPRCVVATSPVPSSAAQVTLPSVVATPPGSVAAVSMLKPAVFPTHAGLAEKLPSEKSSLARNTSKR